MERIWRGRLEGVEVELKKFLCSSYGKAKREMTMKSLERKGPVTKNMAYKELKVREPDKKLKGKSER